MALNHIVVMGRLTRDPELRHTGSGIPVASFTLAVDRDYKAKDAERETDFIDIVAWRHLGEFASKYFSKGRAAVVSGRLEIRNYTDKENVKRRVAEIIAENIYFADSKRDDNGTTNSSYGSNHGSGTGDSGNESYPVLDDDDGELPF